ncbi:asparagine synthase-related protein [Streptomyces sp. H39-S7]|uniref:asparagine synthase-related protein n=1 Tax=Streptomyces sp. H39-S7 TaxID=3004357 RepID=UPI0022AF55E1|nr:asparagine synthase-related protein [Streptomyces sp. H39-S7]MCZ4125088.1 asparagine synthase-related protein [Streptomyces sp. H39-S7]
MRWLVGWSSAAAGSLPGTAARSVLPVGAQLLWGDPDPLWAVGDWRPDEVRVIHADPSGATFPGGSTYSGSGSGARSGAAYGSNGYGSGSNDYNGSSSRGTGNGYRGANGYGDSNGSTYGGGHGSGYGSSHPAIARIAILGRCHASDAQLRVGLFAARGGALRHLTAWPGSYTAVLQLGRRITILGDLAGARPVFHTRWAGGTAFATAALPLADLTEAGLDVTHLAATLACPDSPEALGDVSVRLQEAAARPAPAERPGDLRARAALARHAADHRVFEQAVEVRSQRLHAPFLDNQVVRACRALPEALRVQPGARVSVLRAVLAGSGIRELPPGWGANSHVSTAAAFRTGLRSSVDDLIELFDTPLLADAGLVEARVVRQALRAAADGEALPLDGLGELVATEVWLRRLLARRGSCWTGTDAPEQRAVAGGVRRLTM